MTTIKTTCSICGDVELGPADIQLDLDPSGETGNYRFDCRDCGFTQTRPANARVVMVLLATGVSYQITTAITEEEIQAFARALEMEDSPMRLLAS